MDGGDEEIPSASRRLAVIEKANVYKMKNDVNMRAMANRAIMQELGNNIKLTAKKIRLKSRSEHLSTNQTEAKGPVVEGYDHGEPPTPGIQSVAVSPPKSSKIPVVAGVVRRNMTRKKANTQQRNIIQDYRPGYTWNRGGRVKELRIRCIARKFYNLWKVKVFGRLLPSIAREHYQRRLLKWTFSAWSELWWEVRKEWALTVRADLHNRYRIWNKVWHAWREYTLTARVKTIQKRIADHHAKRCLCDRVLQAWIIYVQMRRTKKALYLKADDRYRESLKSQAWHRWQQQYDLALFRKHQEVAALQHWASTITSKAWHLWRTRLHEIEKQHQRNKLAVTHYEKTLTRQGFQAWCQYVKAKRFKHAEYVKASAWHRQHQLKRYINVWYDRYIVSQQMAEHQASIDSLAQRVLCRRVFVHWKFYIHLRKEGYEKKALAAAHYRIHLLKSALAAWKLYISQKRIQILRHQLAMEFYYHMLLRRAWLLWLERCEEKEDTRLVLQNCKAYSHYNKTLVVKAWQAWRQYVTWRQHRKAQYMKAEVFYITQALPKYLDRWRLFTQMSQKKREMVETAAIFRRENLLAKFFYQWHTEYEHSQDMRLAERMAILHHEEVTKRQTFALWWSKTQDSLEESFKMTVSREHYERNLCKKVLCQWKGIIIDKKIMARHTYTAIRHWYAHLMHKVLQAWKLYFTERRHKKELKAKADTHHHRKLLRLTFTRWQHYHGWWGEVCAYVEAKMKEKNQQLLRRTLRLWHSHAQELRLESEKYNIAVAQHNTTLLHKVIVSWHSYAVMRALKKQKTDELIKHAQAVLNKGKLKRYLKQWQRAKSDAVSMRLKEERAEQHYTRTLVGKAWTAWQDMVKLNVRKQLLMRQAMWFHNRRLQYHSFKQWKTAYKAAEGNKQKTNLALWHWCLSLEKKVFSAWMWYTADRRRKAKRVAAALQSYHRRLLRDGVIQWLVVASDMSEMRQKFAAERGAQNYYHLHQIVLRCASHWRHLTAKHKLERGGTTPSQQQPIRAEQVLSGPVEVLPSRTRPPSGVLMPEPSMSPAREPARLAASRIHRPAPRKPNFLLDSLKREGLYQSEENSNINQEVHLTKNASAVSYESKTEVLPPGDRQDPLCLPARQRIMEDGRFVGFETSTSLETQARGHHSQTSAFSYISCVNSNGTTQTRSIGNQRSYPDDLDLEPRPLPQPSLEHSKGIEFERSDDLNISYSVASTCHSDGIEQTIHNDITAQRRSRHAQDQLQQTPAPCTGSSIDQTRGDGTQNQPSSPPAIQLLPPEAFMHHKDGTPIIPGTGQQASGSNPDPDVSLPSAVSDQPKYPENIINPAEELILIRNRLKQFQDWKKQLKRSRAIHKQLSGWLQDQLSQNVLAEGDPDIKQIQEEIVILEDEIKTLVEQIENEKPNVCRLSKRVEQLLSVVT